MKVFAVVVTYNRLELLKKALSALKRQTRPLDEILVVNNGCTDGTAGWLGEQTGVTVITQENIGGSGGFWRGMKEAYGRGADYIWCMDDDVHPYDDCLERLLNAMPDGGGVVAPMRLYGGKETVTGGECKHFNLSNPFMSLKRDATLDDICRCDAVMDVEAIAFEGPMFSRNVVDSVGLPEKGLFIFWDDTEYSYRAFSRGFTVRYVKAARLYKEDLRPKGLSSAVRRSWKYPYMVRNEAFFVCRYGASAWFKAVYVARLFFRYAFGMAKHIASRDGKYVPADIFVMARSLRDGCTGKLGKY